MNIKTISATYERKIDLGDWNSVKVGGTLWADITEDEDAASCMNELYEIIKDGVKAQVKPLVGKKPTIQMTQMFAGKPVIGDDKAALLSGLDRPDYTPGEGAR
jgi:hypothetical protein